jgi:SagB-type dehydrogenase family enzyme
MTWIDLGNPFPLDRPVKYQPYMWTTQDFEYLTTPVDLELPGFEKIVAERRTRRTFEFLNRNQLAEFLWLSSRTLAKGGDSLGFPITQRPVPSPGAIHSIHLLLCNQSDSWLRYDPDQHGLASLSEIDNPLAGLWDAISQVVNPQAGTALLFVAEPGKIYAKYQYGNSLIWRDAGVIIGHMALVAEALNLNFCPLGITGEPWVSNLTRRHQFVGVGVALLGSRANI